RRNPGVSKPRDIRTSSKNIGQATVRCCPRCRPNLTSCYSHLQGRCVCLSRFSKRLRTRPSIANGRHYPYALVIAIAHSVQYRTVAARQLKIISASSCGQSSSFPRFDCSTIHVPTRNAFATVVTIGLSPNPVGKKLVSTTNTFGTS